MPSVGWTTMMSTPSGSSTLYISSTLCGGRWRQQAVSGSGTSGVWFAASHGFPDFLSDFGSLCTVHLIQCSRRARARTCSLRQVEKRLGCTLSRAASRSCTLRCRLALRSLTWPWQADTIRWMRSGACVFPQQYDLNKSVLNEN